MTVTYQTFKIDNLSINFMQMHYSIDINTPEGRITFYLNKIETKDSMAYHVSGVDRDNKSMIFFMQKHGNLWLINKLETFPEWISDIESKFSDFLNKIEQRRK